MTYHLERTLSTKTNVLNESYVVDKAVLFPEKLWEALECDSLIFRWTKDGKGVVVDADLFENNVIETFPGLVQIAQFLNFRRQMRWYGFAWEQRSETQFVFFHPCFVRNNKDLAIRLTARKRPMTNETANSVPRRRGRPPRSESGKNEAGSTQTPLHKKRKYIRRKLVGSNRLANGVNVSSSSTGSKFVESNPASTTRENNGSQGSKLNVLVELEAIGIELMSLRRMLEWLCVKIANRVPLAEELFSLPSVITTDTFINEDILSESDANSQLSNIVLASGLPCPPPISDNDDLMTFGLNSFNTAEPVCSVNSQDSATDRILDANLEMDTTFDSL